MGEEDKILRQIAVLEDEHRKLDTRITQEITNLDQMSLQRLKRRKLWIKDEMSRLFSCLEPDIIA